MTVQSGLVPLLDEQSGRFPDEFAPPSVAADAVAAQDAAEAAGRAQEAAEAAENNAAEHEREAGQIVEDATATIPGLISEQVTAQIDPKVAAAAQAKNDAETARGAAQTARDDALQAKAQAVAAQGAAAGSAGAAATSAGSAADSAQTATQAKNDAQTALEAVPGAVATEVASQVAPQVTAATQAKDAAGTSATAAAESAGQAQQSAQAAEDAADQALANAVGALPEWNATLGEYPAAQLELWLKRIRDGKSYGIEIPKGLSTACTKLGANAGIAVPIPGTNAVPAVDPYTQRGPFAYFEVNGFVDPDGSPHVTAIMGDGRFTRDGSNGDVWIMAPVLFWRWVSLVDAVQLWVCDTQLAGFIAQPKAFLPSGTRRPFMLYAKYAMSRPDGTTPRSISGQPPANRTITHNSLLTICQTATTGYAGWSYADKWYLDAMFLIKYATKNFQAVFAGCTSHSQQYAPAVAETGVKRVIVTTAQAANFPIGSEIMLGANTPTATDRNAAQLYDVIASAKITGKEVVGSNTALLLRDLASPIDTATTQLLSTAPWRTGACDAVVGDGSPYNPLSGREPAQIQGIGDLFNGATSIIGDLILSNVGAGWEPCLVLDSRNAATSVTAAYKRAGKYLPTDETDSWKYPLYPECVDGLLFGTTVGASQSTGLCDGHYTSKAAVIGARVWRALGDLSNGGYAGLWCIHGYYALSDGDWRIASRLSANGRAS